MRQSEDIQQADHWWIRDRFTRLEESIGALDEKVDDLTASQKVAVALAERRERLFRWAFGAVAVIIALPASVLGVIEIVGRLQ